MTKRNTSGIKNISWNNDRKHYTFSKAINGKRLQTNFKVLQDAIDFKAEYLKEHYKTIHPKNRL